MAQPQNGVVSRIDVRGNQRIEADTIRSYMLVQPGDAYTPDASDRSLRTLFATGLFKDVQISRNGDVLVVQVQENPIIGRVAFEGNSKLSDDTLREGLLLRQRGVFTPAAAQTDKQRLLEAYARRGRFAAQVEPKIIERPQNTVDVVFEIVEGDPAFISRINFVGNEAFSDSRLKEVVSLREEAWYRLFSSADTYQPEMLNFDRELLQRYYQRNGYADAEVTGAVAELAPDRSSFFITFTINEGKRYRVGKVDVTSTLRRAPAEALRPQVELRPGDWYDGDAVERSSQALMDAANLAGEPFAEVEAKVTRDSERGIIDLAYPVVEGQRRYVDRIDINGNTRTQDRVIRREFRLAEGDAFNSAQMMRSRQRIRDLGYFQDVQITPTPVPGSPDKVNLNTAVSERATGEISIGGGYSTDAGALADLGLRERNLLGTGVDGRINGTIAQRRSQVDLSVTDPSFLDRNLAVGLDLFYVVRDLSEYSGYEERRYGFSLRAGYEFNERLRQSWAYTLSRRNVFNIDDEASEYIKEQEGVTWLSQVGQTLTYDTRDSRLDPHNGYVLRLGTDVAGLGGDVAYLRTRLDGTYYVPFERWLGDPDYVLAISAGFGHMASIGGRSKQERIIDRFFLGGENLRGFAVAGAGPRDVSSDDALGGRVMWTQSTEMRFPLPIPSELGLLGRAFVDVGSLSETRASGVDIRDDSSPRVGAGVGISWRSPFGLINIDLAKAVVKKSYDETQVFRFGFGTRF